MSTSFKASDRVTLVAVTVYASLFRLPCVYKGRGSISHRVLNMAKKAGVKLSMHRLRKGFGCRAAKMLGKGNVRMIHESQGLAFGVKAGNHLAGVHAGF